MKDNGVFEMTYYAGKSIGLRMVGVASQHYTGVSHHAILYRNDKDGDSVFDPFSYGSDSILLMAGCEMHVQCMGGAVSVSSPRLSNDVVVDYRSYSSPEQAVRTAILFLAAAIGYGMEVDRLTKRDAANDN